MIAVSHLFKLITQDEAEISGSKGSANFVWRCGNCKVSHVSLGALLGLRLGNHPMRPAGQMSLFQGELFSSSSRWETEPSPCISAS